MDNQCQRCHEEHEDLRTLSMACSYNMSELKLPFMVEDSGVFYTLSVCKRCRSDWMHFIKIWFDNPNMNTIPYEERGSGIFIRDLGCNREISEEGFKKLHPDREPVRVKK